MGKSGDGAGQTPAAPIRAPPSLQKRVKGRRMRVPYGVVVACRAGGMSPPLRVGVVSVVIINGVVIFGFILREVGFIVPGEFIED